MRKSDSKREDRERMRSATVHVEETGESKLPTHCGTLQQIASQCNTLQRTATYYNTLQHAATRCNTLQHTATNCNTLQHTIAHGNTLQHTATHHSTLQHTTCNILPVHTCSRQIFRRIRNRPLSNGPLSNRLQDTLASRTCFLRRAVCCIQKDSTLYLWSTTHKKQLVIRNFLLPASCFLLPASFFLFFLSIYTHSSMCGD